MVKKNLTTGLQEKWMENETEIQKRSKLDQTVR